MTLQEHLEEYKREGYTVFPGYLSAAEAAEWRRAMDPEFDRLFRRSPAKTGMQIVSILAHEGLARWRRDMSPGR